MNVTVSLNADDRGLSVICLIDKKLQGEILAQVEQSEKDADLLLERIAERMPSMLSSCLDRDPSRPTPEQMSIAVELCYTLGLPIPVGAVRNWQSMQEFLEEHADAFMRERPEYSVSKTGKHKRE